MNRRDVVTNIVHVPGGHVPGVLARGGSFLRVLVVGAVFLCTDGRAQQADQRDTHESSPQSTRKALDSQLLEGLDATRPRSSRGSGAQRGDSPVTPQQGTLTPRVIGSDATRENPLIRISSQMRQVELRLQERDVAERTQAMQQQIVAELDDLIAALAASQSNSMQQQAEDRQNSPKKQGSSTGRESAQNNSGQLGKTNAKEASGMVSPATLSDIWGHLPERYRRQVQNASAVEFLPQYRKLIEGYYKRLSEDRGTRN